MRDVESKLQPLHMTRVYATVSDRSPVILVHYLFALGKSDYLPVCERGKLVGVIVRADLVRMLTPTRYVHMAPPSVKQPVTHKPVEVEVSKTVRVAREPVVDGDMHGDVSVPLPPSHVDSGSLVHFDEAAPMRAAEVAAVVDQQSDAERDQRIRDFETALAAVEPDFNGGAEQPPLSAPTESNLDLVVLRDFPSHVAEEVARGIVEQEGPQVPVTEVERDVPLRIVSVAREPKLSASKRASINVDAKIAAENLETLDL